MEGNVELIDDMEDELAGINPLMYLMSNDGVIEAYGFDESILPAEIGDIVGLHFSEFILNKTARERFQSALAVVAASGEWQSYEDTIHFPAGALRMQILISENDSNNVAVYLFPLNQPAIIIFMDEWKQSRSV